MHRQYKMVKGLFGSLALWTGEPLIHIDHSLSSFEEKLCCSVTCNSLFREVAIMAWKGVFKELRL